MQTSTTTDKVSLPRRWMQPTAVMLWVLIWQLAVMLDSRRIIGMCENPDRYDEQINSWYEMALGDKDERIQHHAADSLFGFYLRKKNYEMAEKYLNYFSDYDPMKKVKQGQLYMKQGKKRRGI